MKRLFILVLAFTLAAECAHAGCGTASTGRVGLSSRLRVRQTNARVTIRQTARVNASACQ